MKVWSRLVERLHTHRCYCEDPVCQRRVRNDDDEHFAIHPECVARITEIGRWAGVATKGTQ